MGKIELQRALRAINRSFAVEYLGGACARCGTQDRKLQFDHIDPATKAVEVTKLLSSARATLLAEIVKCQLLCRPCHVLKTKEDNGQPLSPLHGTVTRAINYRCKCTECRAVRARIMNEWRWRHGVQKREDKPGRGHGLRREYHNGCRCTLCTKAQRDYMRKYYRKKHGLVAEQD